MTNVEANVAAHYGSGGLYDRIVGALKASGHDLGRITPELLKPVDEFHIGGAAATHELLDQVKVGPETRVLDIGSGIGGTARDIITHYGAKVTGLDLTPEFVDAARQLSKLVGLDIDFRVGSALDLPFEPGSFDLAALIHVGMNLPDKPRLFAEVARVLVPGGIFAVYDVMQVGPNHPAFPLPWASTPDHSFLDRPDVYESAAKAAGFEKVATRSRRDYAIAFFERQIAAAGQSSPPPLGLPLLMGAGAQDKFRNMIAAVRAGDIAPVEMIFRKP